MGILTADRPLDAARPAGVRVRQKQLVGVVAGAAVIVAGTAVVVLNRPGDSTVDSRATGRFAEPAAAAQAPAPVPAAPVVKREPGKPVTAGLQSLRITPEAGARGVDVPKRDTGRFSLLGLTWADQKMAVGGTVQVRTRAVRDGRWSGWLTLETAGTRGPDSGAEAGRDLRGGTEPMWVGPSDGVAARVVGAGGSKPLPAGLRLDLVDPDKPVGASAGQGGGLELGPSDPPSGPAAPSASASGPVVPPAQSVPVVPLPSYTSRQGWQANEAIVKAPPAIAPAVEAFFVHHTADGGSTYACQDSPAWVRAIQTYQVTASGWDDIGYNFLVDRCGTLFEGRAGGVDKAVVGAHTYGFNTATSSIAVLGTYTATGVPDAARTVIAQVGAARLTAYGFDPVSTATLQERAPDGKFPQGAMVDFARISGHRDGVATECPGDGLYAQLPAIRVDASARVLGLTAKAPGGGVSSGGKYYVKGQATLSWAAATPSASISKFELLVDGSPAATVAGTARSGSVPVPSGTHTVAVRATHVSGNAETAPATTVISDVTLPKVSVPVVSFRTGTVSTTVVPVAVTFKATDDIKVAGVAATAPAAATLAATATTWATSARPGRATTYTISAKDLVGNAGKASVARTVLPQQETAAKRTGTWTTKGATAHLNGKALYSAKKNTKLTFTFTGRAASLIVGRSTKAGKAYVYVDGRKVATIDTKASRTLYRQAIWTRTFTAAKHTVQVVVVATSGRPGVTVDGLAYVK